MTSLNMQINPVITEPIMPRSEFINQRVWTGRFADIQTLSNLWSRICIVLEVPQEGWWVICERSRNISSTKHKISVSHLCSLDHPTTEKLECCGPRCRVHLDMLSPIPGVRSTHENALKSRGKHSKPQPQKMFSSY